MKPKNKELNEAHILHENMKWNCKKLQKSSSQDVQEAMKYFGGEAEMKWEWKSTSRRIKTYIVFHTC